MVDIDPPATTDPFAGVLDEPARPTETLDQVASESLENTRQTLADDPQGRPLTENAPLQADVGFRDQPNVTPDDVTNGSYPLNEMKSTVFGDETTVVLPDGTRMPAYWAFAEAPEMKPSNNVYGGKTPQGGIPKDPVTGEWNHRADDYADPTSGSTSYRTHQRMVNNPDIERFFDISSGTEIGTPVATVSGYPDSGATGQWRCSACTKAGSTLPPSRSRLNSAQSRSGLTLE